MPASAQGCTRWGELGETLLFHAKLSAYLGAPTEFRLLNTPCAVGGGEFQVLRCGMGDPSAEVAAIEKMIRTDPTGQTPLCAQIQQVTRCIADEASRLRASGQRCLVTVASDGKATDGEIAEAMRSLHHLPVSTTVRLCTDNDDVVQYWNNIDEDLELDLDVLDDFCGEAREVAEGGNGWMTYGMHLHRLREWGITRKVLDLIDEAPLSASQMRESVLLIAGQQFAEALPEPVPSRWSEFESRVVTINQTLGRPFKLESLH
jgi:hypothetical protein